MSDRMLAVMWKIKDPAWGYAEKSELHLFSGKTLEEHIAERHGVYNPDIADVIGVKELDPVFPPTYMIDLQRKYDFGVVSNIGQTDATRGLMVLSSDYSEMIMKGEEFYIPCYTKI